MFAPFVSVIVPVYNVKPYLSACIESILGQSYSTFELILVDDGSTDGGGGVCDAYAAKDPRIRVVHKKNGGLSDARNVGIEISMGDFILCVDSDDCVGKCHIESLVNSAIKDNADVVISWCRLLGETEKIKDEVSDDGESKVFTNDEALVYMLYQKGCDTAAWGKLYKKSLFEDVSYPVGLIYEDLATTFKLIKKAKVVTRINCDSYYYRVRQNSLDRGSYSEKKFESALQVLSILESELTNCTSPVYEALKCRIVAFAFHILREIPKSHKDKREKLIQVIKRYRFSVCLNNRAKLKLRVASLFVNVLNRLL